jgi:hypothetical protein
VLPTLYDDGGFSGGTMERPALKRLIADIEAGKIDVVVVYKVDRLTRALSDFAKLVDVFDRRGVSFVSINTTTSMGRLTPWRGSTPQRQCLSRRAPGDCRPAAVGRCPGRACRKPRGAGKWSARKPPQPADRHGF